MIHMVTGEYPPVRGGVADYTAVVASALAAAGVAVHVWCPGDEPSPVAESGVVVHRSLGVMDREALARASRALAAYAAPRRLVVQWVPHAFGRRALNLGFCLWVLRRARAGDRVEIVVHEPFLPFSMRPRLAAAATVQRLMTAVLLRAASHVWVVTPAWEPMWRPYTLGRSIPFTWLPEPASIPATATPEDAARARATVCPGGGPIVGSFACGSPFAQRVLGSVVPAVLTRHASASVLLIGEASIATRHTIVARNPGLAPRVHATGPLPGRAVSAHLSACDLMVQPYPDGICTRHSSAMTVLAHALPMVANEGRFTEAVWRASGAACVVPSSDARGIAQEVDRLLVDTAARHAVAKEAIATYRTRFDVHATVDALVGAGACA